MHNNKYHHHVHQSLSTLPQICVFKIVITEKKKNVLFKLSSSKTHTSLHNDKMNHTNLFT